MAVGRKSNGKGRVRRGKYSVVWWRTLVGAVYRGGKSKDVSFLGKEEEG